MRKQFILAALLLLISSTVTANFIGIAPSAAKIGEIDPGTRKEITLHITANSIDRKFKVNPSYRNPLGDLYESETLVDPERVSEQDIKSWIKFDQDEYVIDPSTEYQARVGGVIANAVGNVTMIIDVPHDAEPGDHAGRIRPNSKLNTGGRGYGAQVKAVQDFQFSFRVPGPVQRQIQLQDMRAIRTGENSIRVDTFLRNMGTVTTSFRGGDIKVLNSFGEMIGTISVPSARLERGEIERISEEFTSKKIAGGDYQVTGQVMYNPTGAISFDEILNVPDSINFVAPDEGGPTGQTGSSREKLPLWLIIMGLTVLGVLMYSFEIDPTVIILFLAVIGIIVTVVRTEISNLYLVIVAGIVAAFYYMM